MHDSEIARISKSSTLNVHMVHKQMQKLKQGRQIRLLTTHFLNICITPSAPPSNLPSSGVQKKRGWGAKFSFSLFAWVAGITDARIDFSQFSVHRKDLEYSPNAPTSPPPPLPPKCFWFE